MIPREYGRRCHLADEAERQLTCLARHVCAMTGLDERRRFMDKMKQRRGTMFAGKLDDAVRAEWEKQQGSR